MLNDITTNAQTRASLPIALLSDATLLKKFFGK